mmetsp:Transcript_37039/g.106911  ORF Transcript_37039/g.106911 Transcript_37039/m.106911 type:complete len:218 (-) Transcript_37039:37-690(-)
MGRGGHPWAPRARLCLREERAHGERSARLREQPGQHPVLRRAGDAARVRARREVQRRLGRRPEGPRRRGPRRRLRRGHYEGGPDACGGDRSPGRERLDGVAPLRLPLALRQLREHRDPHAAGQSGRLAVHPRQRRADGGGFGQQAEQRPHGAVPKGARRADAECEAHGGRRLRRVAAGRGRQGRCGQGIADLRGQAEEEGGEDRAPRRAVLRQAFGH